MAPKQLARKLSAANGDPGGAKSAGNNATEIFVDPMHGGPLPMYVESEVDDADQLIELITRHGGQVSSGYSNVNHIIVNPNTEAGRNLARQYAGKKSKAVLSSDWVNICIKKGRLQVYNDNWAGCRLVGYDSPTINQPPTNAVPAASTPEPPSEPAPAAPRGKKRPRPSNEPQPPVHIPPPPGSMVPPPPPPSYPMTAVSTLANPSHLANWNNLTAHPHPHQQHPHHMPHMPPGPQMSRIPAYPPGPGMGPPPPPPAPPAQMAQAMRWEGFAPPPPQHYPFNYAPPPADAWEDNPYYPPFQPPPPPSAYTQDEAYVNTSHFESPSNEEEEEPDPAQHAPQPAPEPERGRPTHRTPRPSTARQSIAQAGSSRQFPAKRPLARSPTPPTRIMKSTFGGNLFTSEDILYLKKYIDYCQQQGLILSLREICERLAIKAPHHTFYSWRRFCNKHQIKLGAYDMSVFKAHTAEDVSGVGSSSLSLAGPSHGRADSDEEGDEGEGDEFDEEEEDDDVRNGIMHGPGPNTISMPAPPRGRAVQAPAAAGYIPHQSRDRSPTPPKTLYRSTTGKGVAFTEEDVTFLLKYLQYAQGQDMVQVWRDIAAKAPHHSRASWMKYWRRHKHEYDSARPPTLPQAGPDEPAMKRKRYDRSDDIMLARLWLSKPADTSDKIFQRFAALPEHSHHPWKGWQEHHRIHKAKIDHIIAEIEAGTFKE